MEKIKRFCYFVSVGITSIVTAVVGLFIWCRALTNVYMQISQYTGTFTKADLQVIFTGLAFVAVGVLLCIAAVANAHCVIKIVQEYNELADSARRRLNRNLMKTMD